MLKFYRKVVLYGKMFYICCINNLQNIKAMTSAQIKAAAEKAGWDIEISDHKSDPDVKFIGIHPGREVWYWWRVETMFYTGNEICSFDHAYSRNTGKTKKGFWTVKFPIEKRIENVLSK